jgi:hypothetical protein
VESELSGSKVEVRGNRRGYGSVNVVYVLADAVVLWLHCRLRLVLVLVLGHCGTRANTLIDPATNKRHLKIIRIDLTVLYLPPHVNSRTRQTFLRTDGVSRECLIIAE